MAKGSKTEDKGYKVFVACTVTSLGSEEANIFFPLSRQSLTVNARRLISDPVRQKSFCRAWLRQVDAGVGQVQVGQVGNPPVDVSLPLHQIYFTAGEKLVKFISWGQMHRVRREARQMRQSSVLNPS